MSTQRLPYPGSDDGDWGTILNDFLEVSLNGDGTLAQSSLIQAGGVTSVNTVTPNSGNVTLTAANVGALTQSSADSRYVPQTELGASGGVATLTGTTLTSSQLPNSVVIGSALADWTISINGSTVTATPRSSSGSSAISSTDAYTAIQGAINAVVTAQGGSIHVCAGTYNLSAPLVITGWQDTFFTTSQVIFEGEGQDTLLKNTIAGNNTLIIKNGASVVIRNFELFSSGQSALLLDDSGTNMELSCIFSVFDNLLLNQNSATFAAGEFKNFMSLVAMNLRANNGTAGGDALQFINTSTTTNYGNSNFGLVTCTVATTGAGAGLRITSTGAGHMMNLLSFDHYQIVSTNTSSYGLYAQGLYDSRFKFVDIEGVGFPIYFDGSNTDALHETRYVTIADGYILTGGTTSITTTLDTGGNKFQCVVDKAISDASNFRPANVWDLLVPNTFTLPSFANLSTQYRFRLTNGKVISSVHSEVVNTVASSGTAQTLPDPGANGQTMSNVTLTGNCVFTMPTARAGERLTVRLLQDATGSRAPTFTGVKWPGGSAPSWSTAAGAVDMVTLTCVDGATWDGSASIGLA